MRYSLLASALVIVASTLGFAADSAPKRIVYLNHLALEELKTSNPRHYAYARQAMAAAAELCKPGAARVFQVGESRVSCSGALLKTSNPPKREISFALDDTIYIALVTMKDAAPTFHPAAQDEPVRVMPAK